MMDRSNPGNIFAEGYQLPSPRKRKRCHSTSSSEQAVRADSEFFKRKCPPPTGLEMDRLNDHITLQDFGHNLQKAANAIFPENQTSRYTKFEVLLISWEDEDPKLPVSLEINELADIFERIYGYDVEKWLIPSDNPHITLQTKILRFLGTSDPAHLKIVYYAGHGKLTTHGQSAWTSHLNKGKERCSTVKWSGIQNTLEESQSDVLILLDSCASGVCTTDEGNGVTELIAACPYNAIANGVGPYSFTHALCLKLRALAQLPSFTIGYLYNTIFTEVQSWKIEDPRHKKAPIHLVLSQNPEWPRSIQLSKSPSRSRVSTTNPSFQQGYYRVCDLPRPDSPMSTSTTEADTSVSSPNTSFSEIPEYPRLLLSIRFTEDVKPSDLSATLFKEWLRSVPASISLVRVEAGFVSDSTILILSLPASIIGHLKSDPAITLLGTTRSANLMAPPTQQLSGPFMMKKAVHIPKPKFSSAGASKIPVLSLDTPNNEPLPLGSPDLPAMQAKLTEEERRDLMGELLKGSNISTTNLLRFLTTESSTDMASLLESIPLPPGRTSQEYMEELEDIQATLPYQSPIRLATESASHYEPPWPTKHARQNSGPMPGMLTPAPSTYDGPSSPMSMLSHESERWGRSRSNTERSTNSILPIKASEAEDFAPPSRQSTLESLKSTDNKHVKRPSVVISTFDNADDDDMNDDQSPAFHPRKKDKIEFMTDKSRREIQFNKRKASVTKGAHELSIITGTQVLLVIVSETGLVYTYTTPKLQPVITMSEGKTTIQACINAPDPEPEHAEEGSTFDASSPKPPEESYVVVDPSSPKPSENRLSVQSSLLKPHPNVK